MDKEIKQKHITARDTQKGSAYFEKGQWACTFTPTPAYPFQGAQAALSEALEKCHSPLPACRRSIDEGSHGQMRTRRLVALTEQPDR